MTTRRRFLSLASWTAISSMLVFSQNNPLRSAQNPVSLRVDKGPRLPGLVTVMSLRASEILSSMAAIEKSLSLPPRCWIYDRLLANAVGGPSHGESHFLFEQRFSNRSIKPSRIFRILLTPGTRMRFVGRSKWHTGWD